MNHIQDVIRHTVTPSWLNSVPYNFGEAAAGTLKADEWRNMANLYLPIALVTRWGEGTTHATHEVGIRLRKALDHTMSLFTAAHLACMRTTSKSRAMAYRKHMIDYVQGLPNIHPDATKRTNHHMALHIYDFLLLFGPVHSWWCFPFERLIGILQRLPTNNKFGE